MMFTAAASIVTNTETKSMSIERGLGRYITCIHTVKYYAAIKTNTLAFCHSTERDFGKDCRRKLR